MAGWGDWLSALWGLSLTRRALAHAERSVLALRAELESSHSEAAETERRLRIEHGRLEAVVSQLAADFRKIAETLDELREQAAQTREAQLGRTSQVEELAKSVQRDGWNLRTRIDRIAPCFPRLPDLGSADSAARFYAELEEKFRGPRDLIRDRLRVYLPFLAPLRDGASPVRALDLGCGRGEWLELLGAEGIHATGIDENPVMVDRCVKLGLDAVRADALEYLRAQRDSAHAVVTCFHVIEHLPPETAVAWLLEARRVLRPGGVLILETPNAENLVAAASTFHCDPTHRHPVPAVLLRFMVEFARFNVIDILALQPDEPLIEVGNNEGWPPTLKRLLGGARDIGVVATVPSTAA